MATYYCHFKNWIQTFPIVIGCATLSIIFTIIHHSIPLEILKDYLFNEYFGIYIWIIFLSPFGIEYLKIHRKKKRYPEKYLKNNGKRSYRLFLDESHVPSFYAMDLVSLFTLIVVLMIDVGFAVPKDGFVPAYFFERVCSIVVVPFFAYIVYFLKTLRDESISNKIINPWG